MRKINPPRQSVIIVDGKKYDAKYVGKGQYSKVFRVGDRVVYYTKGDCGKEVLSLYVYDKETHLPELIRHENVMDYFVFSSPYYRNVKRTDSSAYRVMNTLIKEFRIFMSEYRHYQQQAYGRVTDGERSMLAFVKYLQKAKMVPQSIIRVLFRLYELARNCGDSIGFDFKRSNFGVNEYGTLIFRDPIWVWG